MVGVLNRHPHVICEVCTCTWRASHTEFVIVIPNAPSLKNERHRTDVVLCQTHDAEFQSNGLVGVMTAHGDTIVVSH